MIIASTLLLENSTLSHHLCKPNIIFTVTAYHVLPASILRVLSTFFDAPTPIFNSHCGRTVCLLATFYYRFWSSDLLPNGCALENQGTDSVSQFASLLQIRRPNSVASVEFRKSSYQILYFS